MSTRAKRASDSTAEPSAGIGHAISRAAGDVAEVPVQGAISALAMGIVVERRARAAASSLASRVGLGVLDATLGRVFAEDVIDRVLDRMDAAQLPQRISERMLESGIVEQIATRVIEGPELERVLGVAMRSEQVQGTLARALEDEAAERLMDRLASSAGSERLLTLLLGGPLPEEIVSRLLENEALWIFVDEIARSPSVTEAIQHQGAGFVDEVADRARDRSRNADAWVQRVARRVGRRRKDGTNDLPPSSPLPHIDAP